MGNKHKQRDRTKKKKKMMKCIGKHKSDAGKDSKDARADSVASLAVENLEDVAKIISQGRVKRIVWLSGAGISCSAGIPDFRTPGTGLYDNLQKYKLPRPEDIFDLRFFKRSPQAFFLLAKELLPGSHAPTLTHAFVRLLHEKRLLHRTYTQNIDGLERVAGIPAEKIVEAHGTFASASCVRCGRAYPIDRMRRSILKSKIPKCEACDGIAKPDIVFFGEDLPKRFHEMKKKDMRASDLVIVAGTSLQVLPFANLHRDVFPPIPRLLINREIVGTDGYNGFDFHLCKKKKRHAGWKQRDVAALGDCDRTIERFAELLGWSKELRDMHRSILHRVAKMRKDLRGGGSTEEVAESGHDEREATAERNGAVERGEEDDEVVSSGPAGGENRTDAIKSDKVNKKTDDETIAKNLADRMGKLGL